MESVVAGGLSLRDEVDISNRKHYTTSPPSKVASQGCGISQAKEKATLFRGRLIQLLIKLFLQPFILFNYHINLVLTPT